MIEPVVKEAPPERILVVEDDPIIGTMFQELFADRPPELQVVEDAEAGLAAMEAGPFDLVVTDKNLPGINGLELTRRIKAEHPLVEVIIMTAFADMNSALAALEVGVYDYLVKPFDSIAEVVRKIDRALEKRRLALENLRLVKHLTEANARIEAMNRNLEAEVRERTKKLRIANAQLEQLTLSDDVTGLYNQRFLHQRLREEVRRHERYQDGLALIMLDLDHFKRVNDNHDHLFGSRVLRRIGLVLAKSVRAMDTAVRYGGDEFVIILPHSDLPAATVVAERVRRTIEGTNVGDGAAAEFGETPDDALAGPCTYDDAFFITVSLGVAALGESGADSANSLLQAADRALYAAKEGGRNRTFLVRDGEFEEVSR